LKIITISSTENSEVSAQKINANFIKLEFCKLTKTQLIDYFKQLLKAQRKLKYVNNIDLENHDLFKLYRIDISFLPYIVQEISQ